ncbi:unnamed protein product [Penicillium roqueforti FM164]|uniref:Genomic scaffold, ProqFM164S02 n=1 Tax=Penicillium roqueforti (strain FM164) TaxID=1365484 RepID=W6Q090_PENRF|nr:unnamed protein product [Penicillium roqueforti FM164]
MTNLVRTTRNAQATASIARKGLRVFATAASLRFSPTHRLFLRKHILGCIQPSIVPGELRKPRRVPHQDQSRPDQKPWI